MELQFGIEDGIQHLTVWIAAFPSLVNADSDLKINK